MAELTLARELESSAVDFEQLHRDYKPMLLLVRELIGVIPNCDPYLEIWPIGFRTYNLLVPNLLNLPGSLVGQGAPKDLVGLGMYASSRAAGCMYCSAHTCSYALRRGLSPEAVTGNHTEAEAAVVAVAEALGRVPSELTSAHVDELEGHLGLEDTEWIVLAIALMGFLNKFMDGMGIELEMSAIADVQDLIAPTGWNTGKHQWNDDLHVEKNGLVPEDSFRTYMRIFRQGPSASRLDSKWTKGVSGRIGQALMMLEERVGYSFPVLASLHHKKPVKAIATILRDNLDPETTEIGLGPKCLAGLVFAKVVENEMMLAEMLQLSEFMDLGLDPDLLVDVAHYASDDSDDVSMPEGLTAVQAATISLAKAGSTSPSSINEITISTVTSQLNPVQIVETVVWLAVLQMLHRLYAFYDAKIGIT